MKQEPMGLNFFELNESKDYYAYLDSKLKEYYFIHLKLSIEDEGLLVLDMDNQKALMNKLKADGYINENSEITMEGILFHLDGGYTERKRKLTISTNNKLIQSWAIAIGTSIAGIYSLFQILHGLYSFFCIC